MQLIIPALVSFLVLPVSAFAPIPVAQAHTIPLETKIEAFAAPVSRSLLTLADASIAQAALTVKLTAYNAVPGQTDNTPFTTASGAFSNPEVVAARSRDLASTLPYGTVIEITRTGTDTPSCNFTPVEHQIGYRVIADAMNPRISNTVDVLLDQNRTVSLNGRELNPGIVLGRCGQVSVRVIGHMSIKDIPDTQAELAAMINPSAPTIALAER